MGMTSGWLSRASAERFIVEQYEAFDELFCPCCVDHISVLKTSGVFCIAVVFGNNTKHLLTEADVRFMTGEQSYAI